MQTASFKGAHACIPNSLLVARQTTNTVVSSPICILYSIHRSQTSLTSTGLARSDRMSPYYRPGQTVTRTVSVTISWNSVQFLFLLCYCGFVTFFVTRGKLKMEREREREGERGREGDRGREREWEVEREGELEGEREGVREWERGERESVTKG